MNESSTGFVGIVAVLIERLSVGSSVVLESERHVAEDVHGDHTTPGVVGRAVVLERDGVRYRVLDTELQPDHRQPYLCVHEDTLGGGEEG